MAREITLPEAKPAFEWINGRALQKVRPKRKHGIAQTRFAAALDAWAQEGGRGTVATEWRFQIQPPSENRRPLVPDVAFLSYSRLPFEAQMLVEEPDLAPDVVVEVLSPDDRAADIEEKVRVYLGAGTSVVFLVDPEKRTVHTRDLEGERAFAEDDELRHQALHGFALPVRRLFDVARPRS